MEQDKEVQHATAPDKEILHTMAQEKEVLRKMAQSKEMQHAMAQNNNLKKSELKSIEEIYASTWEPVYRFIYYRVQNRQEAEDITQETYVRALSQRQKRSSEVKKHISYLKMISLNIIRDRWRISKRRGISVDLDTVAQEKMAVEDQTQASAMKQLLLDALSRLSEEQRRIIELRILQGYSVADTASMTKKKEGTVRVIQYRALKLLARMLEEKDRLE